MSPWSPVRVVGWLLTDARGLGDKAWVLLYFVARLSVFGVQPLRFLRPARRLLAWRSSPHPLAASMESGGLSSWYEISGLRTYAPTPAFLPGRGHVVIDIGANVGAYASWAAGAMQSEGVLVSAEPNPISYERLVATLDAIPMAVEARQVACGEAQGEMTLHFQRGYTVSSSFQTFDRADEAVTVAVVRLDALADELALNQVDILKIDVEGAELSVLHGAAGMLPRTRRIVLETTEGANAAAVSELLQGAGFACTHESSAHWGIAGLQLLAFERTDSTPDSYDAR